MTDKIAELAERRTGIIMLALTLAGYAVGIGYNLAAITENARRLAIVEAQMSSHMSKTDASAQYQEVTRRLERIEDKVDRLSVQDGIEVKRRK
jgi:hypothetical protein